MVVIDKVIGYRQSITMLESTMNKLFQEVW